MKAIFDCGHTPSAKVTLVVGTKASESQVCAECVRTMIDKKFPTIVKAGVPFIVRIETADGVLALKGEWEGKPRWLSSKDIGGLLAVWGKDGV